MKLRWMAFAGIFFLLFSACGLTQAVQEGISSGGSSADKEYVFSANADPINVTVALDESRGVQFDVPVGGGILTAQAADGTAFTLAIPPDALLTETTIHMIPVSSLEGLPFGSNPLAVQLEPEGLTFNNYVTLTITPPQEIPLDQQILFGYMGSGQDVILAPPVVNSPEIKIQLLHFSGYGVTKGLLADIEPVRERIGGDAERRLQSLAAERLGAERQRQLLGSGESEGNLDLDDLFKQFEEQVVKPRVAAAGESCAAGRLAMQTLLGFERQKQLLGAGDEGGMASVMDLMNTVGLVCVKEEYEMCVEDHIIHRMIPVWLGMQRQAQLLGMAPDGPTSEALQVAKDLTQKCLTFELQFESQGVFDDSYGGGYTSVVKSKIPIKFNADEIAMRGQAPLYNESFEFSIEGCSVTSNRGGGTFDATSLAYVADTRSVTDEVGYVRDLKLIFFPGVTSESFTVTCEDTPPYTSPPTPLWTGIFLVTHEQELVMQEGEGQGITGVPNIDITGMMMGMGMSAASFPPGMGFVAEEWEVMGGEYFAKKEWVKEDGGLGLVEAGTLKLYHRPGQ